MLKIKMSLFSTEETIDRPILTSTVEDIKKYLGYTNDVYTVFDDKDNIYRKKNIAGELNSPNTLTSEYITIDSTEEMIDDYSRYLGYINPDTKPFYVDEQIGSNTKILYHKKRLNIAFKYSSKSKSGANALINRLRVNNVTEDYYITHNLEYSILLPTKYMHLLKHLNELKENETQTGKTLEKYIEETFDSRVRVVGTLDGNALKDDIALRERQVSAIGYISDDINTINKEYDDDNNTWNVSFTYNVEYEKPVMLIMEYPLVVFNQLIDKKYRVYLDSVPNRLTVRTPAAKAIYDAVTSIPRLNKVYNGQYVVYPPNDIETLPAPMPNYVRTASVMTLVDKSNSKVLFNLNDVKGFKIKNSFMDFIVNSELDYISEPYNSMVHIDIIKDGKSDYKNKVIMDKDLNLTSKLDLDIKSTYRVTVNVLADLSLLSNKSKERTIEYIKYENELLQNTNNSSMRINEVQCKLIDKLPLYSELTTKETTLITKYTEQLTLNHYIGKSEQKIKAYDKAIGVVDASMLSSVNQIEIKNDLDKLLDYTKTAKYTDRASAVNYKIAVAKCKEVNVGLSTTELTNVVDKLILIVNYTQYSMRVCPSRDTIISSLLDPEKIIVESVYDKIDKLTIDIVNNGSYTSKLIELIDYIKNSNMSDMNIRKVSTSVRREYSKKLVELIYNNIESTIIKSSGNNSSIFQPVLDKINDLLNCNPVSIADKDTIQDIYLGLFNVDKNTISSVIEEEEDINKIIFKIELPSSIKFFTKEILVNIVSLIE